MVERATTLPHRSGFIYGVLGWAMAMAGRTEDARAVRNVLAARPEKAPMVVSEAWLLGGLGELDEAFRILQQAEEEGQAVLGLAGLPGFDVLRADPRFESFSERIRLPSNSKRIGPAGAGQ